MNKELRSARIWAVIGILAVTAAFLVPSDRMGIFAGFGAGWLIREWIPLELTARRSAAKLPKTTPTILMLLILPVLTHAQTPIPNPHVGQCVAGVYEECKFISPHWYYKQHGEWARDDGVKEAPPVVQLKGCDDSLQGVINGHNNQVEAQLVMPYPPKIERPRRFDRQFCISTMAFAAAGTFDFASSRGLRENNQKIANAYGHVSGATFVLSNAAMYGTTLLIQMKWPKAANTLRYILSVVHLSVGIHNEVIK
jgi:hypothetical protein